MRAIEIPVLGNGYIKLIETWGSDRRIVEAARMSTQKGFLRWGPGTCPVCKGSGGFKNPVIISPISLEADVCYGCEGKGKVPGDARLLAYLYDNWHHTPFEMAGCIIELKLPIMVTREWHRHRTQFYNEMSARYVQMPNDHYTPTLDRVRAADKKNKQATGGEPLDPILSARFIKEVEEEQQRLYENYEKWLQAGIPKELARINTPVSRMTRMRAGASLRNWLAFLTLRNDMAAQEEIRVYAAALENILTSKFPRTMKLFKIGRAERKAFKVWRSSDRKKVA